MPDGVREELHILAVLDGDQPTRLLQAQYCVQHYTARDSKLEVLCHCLVQRDQAHPAAIEFTEVRVQGEVSEVSSVPVPEEA